MPYKDEHGRRCKIDKDGELTYSTSPAETLGSEAMGVPAKGGSPWTDQALGSSSATKPSRTRQQHRRQMPKQSFLDTNSDKDPVDGDQDDQDDHMHFLRNSASLVSEPFDDVVHPDKSSSVTGPSLGDGKVDESTSFGPRSGQKALVSMTDDGEDEFSSDVRKSPTPKPSRLTSSRNRQMSDASDVPVPSQPVTSSRPREMSEPLIIEERPKKKGIPQFSSLAPSVVDSVDDEESQNVPDSMQNHSDIPSHSAGNTKTKLAHQRKSDLKSKAKVKLLALDLEEHKEMDNENDDPFDQANIPPSRGLSPGPSMRKPKQAPKKQAAEKSSKVPFTKKKPSPKGKEQCAEPPKVSTQKKQPARPRQKAKPSAAKHVEISVASVGGKDNGNNESSMGKPTRPTSHGAQAKEKRTAAAATAPTWTAKASGKHQSDPQEDIVSISSTCYSEDFDTDESDDDEYIDKSRVNAVQGDRQPPKTRNTAAALKDRNESASTTESSGDVQVEEQDDENHDQTHDQDVVASKSLSDKSTVDAVAQASHQNTEVLVSQQTKKEATDTQYLPRPHEPNDACTLQSPAKDQSGFDETETKYLAVEVVTQPLKQAKTAHPTKSMSQNARLDQDESVPAVAQNSEPGRPRTKFTRQSQTNQSGNDSTPSNLKAAQSREQVKENQSLVNPSPMESHDKLSKRAVDTKSKDRKANIISFGADGPRNNGKARQEGSAANHRSGESDSGVVNSNASEAAKSEQMDAGSVSRAYDSGASWHESAGPSKALLAPCSQTEQSFSPVKNQPPAVSPAVDDTVEKHPHSSHVSQMAIYMVAKEPQTVEREDDDDKNSLPTRAINGEEPISRQINMERNIPIGDQHHANDMVDFQFADGADEGLDGPTIPDSLENPDDILDIVSISQMKASAINPKLLNQKLKGGVNNRKRPLSYDFTTQNLEPDNEHSESHSPVIEQEHMSSQHFELKALDCLQPQQSLQKSSPKQQEAEIQKLAVEQVPVLKKQAVREKHSTMSQQHWSAKKPLRREGIDISHMSRDSEAPHHRKAIHPNQQVVKTLTQSGRGASKEPTKMYLQDLSTNLQRPLKKARLDVPRPIAASPVANSNTQFCVPSNSFSSDDVFAPNEGKEGRDVNDGIMNRLRGIESEKDSSEPEMETQRPIDSHTEKWHGPPHQRPSKRLAPKATHTRFVQNAAHDKFRDGHSDDTSGSKLWRRGLLNRHQGRVPLVQHEEQLTVEDPKHHQTIEESMHKIVASVLRALHSKESQIHQVVEDYRAGGGRIVQSIASTHFEEREQLIQEHEDRRLDYLRTCEDARRHINSIGTGLREVDLTIVTAGETMDKTIERLKPIPPSGE